MNREMQRLEEDIRILAGKVRELQIELVEHRHNELLNYLDERARRPMPFDCPVCGHKTLAFKNLEDWSTLESYMTCYGCGKTFIKKDSWEEVKG